MILPVRLRYFSRCADLRGPAHLGRNVLRRFRHWTPGYVFDRLGVIAYQRLHPGAPWLTRAMVDLLTSWLRPEDRGLEWGSGRSTLWLARRVGWLRSIEHDEAYFKGVQRRLQQDGLGNVDCRFCQLEFDYLTAAEDIPTETLDFALVDGLSRDHCALRALPLLKPGGILVLDNCNWYLPSRSRAPGSRRPEDGPASEAWSLLASEVSSWRCLWTTNGVWDTALWVKPASARLPALRDS